MSLNYKDEEGVNLGSEVALLARSRRQPLSQLLERQVWPLIPAHILGTTLTREEEDLILGYGPDGFQPSRF